MKKHNIRPVAMHFKQERLFAPEVNGKGPVIDKLPNLQYFGTKKSLKEVNTIFLGPMEFIRKRKAREGRGEVGFDIKRLLITKL